MSQWPEWSPKPPSLLDPAFRYIDAAHTDVAKTFARLRWLRARAGQQPRKVQIATLVVDRIDAASKVRR